jgi:HEPN domain-containing protein
MTEELELARQWVIKAGNDLLNADNNLNAETIPFDTVCFHCQQAAEKYLKAFLVGKGRTYPITHDLLAILENILPINPDAELLRDDLALLTPYAVEVRYPDDFFMPSLQDASEAREAANSVKNWFENALPEICMKAER